MGLVRMTIAARHVSLTHPAMTRARPLGPWWWRTGAVGLVPAPVWMCCPKGHVGRLDDHSVAADGTVTPSVQCPEGDCDFHDNVRLDAWAP